MSGYRRDEKPKKTVDKANSNSIYQFFGSFGRKQSICEQFQIHHKFIPQLQ
jgi:hypothetical protein